MHPDRYRVTSVVLSSGKFRPVLGRFKQPTQTMSGTRLMQVLSPSRDQLFTLYTNQPAEYAKGYGPESDGGWSVSFVHVLNLEYGWAFCINLPRPFGSGPAEAKAEAISPDGDTLISVSPPAPSRRRSGLTGPSTSQAAPASSRSIPRR